MEEKDERNVDSYWGSHRIKNPTYWCYLDTSTFLQISIKFGGKSYVFKGDVSCDRFERHLGITNIRSNAQVSKTSLLTIIRVRLLKFSVIGSDEKKR